MTATEADVERVADSVSLVLRAAVPGWNDAQVSVDCARAALAAMPDGRDAALIKSLRTLLDAIPEPFDYLDDARGSRLCTAVNDAREVLFNVLVARADPLKAQPASGGWNFDMDAAPVDQHVIVGHPNHPTVVAYQFQFASGRRGWSHTGAKWIAWQHLPAIPSPPEQGSGT